MGSASDLCAFHPCDSLVTKCNVELRQHNPGDDYETGNDRSVYRGGYDGTDGNAVRISTTRL